MDTKTPPGLFFSNDPKIVFTHVICPACKNPTGPKSNCYAETPPENMIISPSNSFVTLFNEGCIFRQDSLYLVDINYPFSKNLLKKLQNVKGLNKIIAISHYRFQIGIAPLFDVDEIKKQVAIIYKTYIKSVAASELDIKTTLTSNKYPAKIIIKMPNGQSTAYEVKNEQDMILHMSNLQEIKNNLEGVEIVFDP